MSGRSCFGISTLLALFLVPFSPPALRAQEAVQVQPTVENSRFQFSGMVNSPDVYVRSGPGEEWYATQKLPPGTQVTVVGIKFDWLKIIPPDGSFCYVSKLYIDRRGDGSVGRVTHSDINVRAGSTFTTVKSTVLGQLNVGDDVKILGEEDEYYKIAPPPGTFLYVNKQLVQPVRAMAVNAAPSDSTEVSSGPRPLDSMSAASPAAASTQPSDAVATEAPATQHAVAEQAPAPSPEEVATTAFNTLEAEFAAASLKPLEDQPAADLAKRYEALSKNTALAPADQQTAGFRLAILKVRLDAQARLADVQKIEDAAAQRDKTLSAERDELQKRLDANEVKLYAAVGQIQPSSLQFGPQTLYRLIDPASGRTLIYIRGDDADAVKYTGQFVGVRGEPSVDERLNVKVIPCTVIEPVDPAQVNTKVMAEIAPQSLISNAVQASSGGN